MSDSDPTRQRIIAAMNVVLAGDSKQWTISELARQAEVGRHLLTQKHTDLRDRFNDRCQALQLPANQQTIELKSKLAKQSAVISELRETLANARATTTGISRTVQGLFRENRILKEENTRLKREIQGLLDRISDQSDYGTVVALRHPISS